MYIYNVTVNVDEGSETEWLAWMMKIHIPDVMKTGCFVDNQVLRVLGVEDPGHTYSVQYRFREMDDIEKYQKQFAASLQAEHRQKFGNKVTAFRTLLQIVD
jgi:hypothetical protein